MSFKNDGNESTDTAVVEEFTLVSIEKIAAPSGSDGDDWYRYVVSRDNSEIIGNTRGTLTQVKKYTQEFVDNLNQRCQFPGARSPWAPTAMQKPRARKA